MFDRTQLKRIHEALGKDKVAQTIPFPMGSTHLKAVQAFLLENRKIHKRKDKYIQKLEKKLDRIGDSLIKILDEKESCDQ